MWPPIGRVEWRSLFVMLLSLHAKWDRKFSQVTKAFPEEEEADAQPSNHSCPLKSKGKVEANRTFGPKHHEIQNRRGKLQSWEVGPSREESSWSPLNTGSTEMEDIRVKLMFSGKGAFSEKQVQKTQVSDLQFINVESNPFCLHGWVVCFLLFLLLQINMIFFVFRIFTNPWMKKKAYVQSQGRFQRPTLAILVFRLSAVDF